MRTVSIRRIAVHELTGPLLRAARALSNFRSEQLAAESGLGLATIKRAEASAGTTALTAANARRLLETYARHGLEIVVVDERAGVLTTVQADMPL